MEETRQSNNTAIIFSFLQIAFILCIFIHMVN